jgi:Protein of unknown function (DUF4235)
MADSPADSQSGSRLWTAFSLVSALIAAAVARKALDTGWRAATGKHPPDNPADPDVQMGEAVAWAVVTGAFVALARMLAQRRAASYYRRSAGHLPPQLQKD